MASVLITGTSKGIGMETALVFARAGYDVLATMRNPSQSPELADRAAAEKLPIAIYPMDVDSDSSVHDAFAAIHKKHGPIDVLVNNAGIERFVSIEELPLEEFRAVMETNYFGALRCMKAVIPQMRERRSGWIVNVTSVAGRISGAPFAAYAASKWALEALSEASAGEMKMFDVHVAIVEPGIIDTAMARRISHHERPSPYPHRNRMAGQFSDSLKNPVSPSLVADKIVDIVASGSWQLRYLVGPDAPGFIEWRRGMTDEEWVDYHSANDETYAKNLKAASDPFKS
jgi:NAD(P)-dependent dehydrogenase (short-subunit alcohol dehydrogenase family)